MRWRSSSGRRCLRLSGVSPLSTPNAPGVRVCCVSATLAALPNSRALRSDRAGSGWKLEKASLLRILFSEGIITAGCACATFRRLDAQPEPRHDLWPARIGNLVILAHTKGLA